MENDFVLALTDFWATDAEELSCSVNDLLRVLRRDSRKTIFAHNYITGCQGLIPTYCVKNVEAPGDFPGGPVFFAVQDYTSREEGDLNFTKGTFVVGDRPVDDSWWYGWAGTSYGLFPVEWVRTLPDSPDLSNETSHLPVPRVFIRESVFPSSDINHVASSSVGRDAVICPKGAVVVSRQKTSSSACEVEKALPDLSSVNRVSHHSASLNCDVPFGPEEAFMHTRSHGRALYDFNSGMANELAFRARDSIFINRRIDENWMEGELSDGTSGIFPTNFVEVIVDLPVRRTERTAETDVLDEMAIESFPPDTYAIVLAEHTAKSEFELTLQAGDTVTILNKRGADWIEAMDDYGNVGYCPTACLEVIGSEPDEVRSSSQLEISSNGSLDSVRSSRDASSPSLSMDSFGAPENKRLSWTDSGISDLQRSYSDGPRGKDAVNRIAKRNSWFNGAEKAPLASQREKIAEEIIVTEKEYIDSVKVCVDILRQGAVLDGFDLKTILGNIDDVLDTARSLLRGLRTAKDDSGQIGECFLRNISSLRAVYIAYCQNNDTTIGLLSQYKDLPELSQYMNEKVAEIRHRTNCFDLASMFIKPLQRILRYPLLLGELLKATDKSHPDYIFVRDSLQQCTEIASGINEVKRRKELVAKYRDSNSVTFAQRLSRLSFHSVVKKSNRLGLLVSSTIGFTTLIQDPAFQSAERRFQVTKRTIKWFLRNVTEFVEQLRALIPGMTSIAEDFSAILKEPSDQAATFANSQDAMSKQIVYEFIPKINVHVVQPLEETLNQFQGPVNLIAKRHEKLIDYENAKRKMDRMKDGQRTQAMLDEVELAKKVYQALNVQLLDELPRFNEITAKILRSRVEAFLHFRKLFFCSCSTAILPCVAVGAGTNKKAAEKNFIQKLEMVITDLKRLDYGSAIQIPELEKSSREDPSQPKLSRAESIQISERPPPPVPRRFAMSRTESLPRPDARPFSPVSPAPSPSPVASTSVHVDRSYKAKDKFELSLSRGDCAQVLKQHDPMGNPDRWFVTYNGKSGFVPKDILSSSDDQKHIAFDKSRTEKSLPRPRSAVSFADEEPKDITVIPKVTERQGISRTNVAAFSFKPYGPHQLPLKQGDKLVVMAKHDLDGNTDWSYVQDCHGAQGYVPSAYLKNFVGMESR